MQIKEKVLSNFCLMSSEKWDSIKHVIKKNCFWASCMRKETVDIEILVTSRNCDRKITESIRITSRPPWRIRKGN